MAEQAAPRFRSERLRMVLEEAKAAGGQVKVNLRTGEALIEFPADGKPLDNAEGERLEELMRTSMPTAKKAARG